MAEPAHWTLVARRILADLHPERPAMPTAAPPRRPAILGWHHASHKRPCPRCGHTINPKDRVAHINNPDPIHVCQGCAR